MKLGIIVGHNSRQKGAEGISPVGEMEFDYNNDVAALMREISDDLGIDARVFNRKYSGSYRKEIEAVYSESDDWGSDATIELHFNAFNSTVAGTETLAGPSNQSLILAMDVHRIVAQLFRRNASTDRGIKEYRYVVRGQLSLVAGACPAILVEPFFGDNRADARLAADLGKEALAHAYMAGAAKWFGLDTPNTVAGNLAHMM